MSTLDLTQAARLFYGDVEVGELWRDGQRLWSSTEARMLALFAGGRRGLAIDLTKTGLRFQDAAGTVPVTAHGDRVGRINDLSPNGFHFTQAVADDRPTFEVIDGASFVSGNGARHHLRTADLDFSHTDKVTIGFALRRLGGARVIAEFGRSYSDGGEWYFSSENNYRVNMGGPGYMQRVHTVPSLATDVLVATLDRANTSSSPRIWLNGLEVGFVTGTSVAGPFNAARPVALLARWTGSNPAVASWSKVAAFFLVDYLVSDMQRLDLQSWLAEKGKVVLP